MQFDDANQSPGTDDRTVERGTLRDVLDGLFAFVGLLSTSGVLLDANDAVVKSFGMKRTDLIGKPLWESYFWSHARTSREKVRDALERAALGEVVRGDYIVRVGDDKFITIDATFGPLRDQSGHVTQIVASAVDVTDRVAHADEARNVRHQLETAQRIANIGSWQWEFATGKLVWSPQCYHLVGWDPQGPAATIEAFLAIAHPDDRRAVIDVMRRAVEEGQDTDFDHRVVLPDGSVRILHQLGEVERDVNDRPVRMIGTSHDVTVLRNACEELIDAKLRAETASQTKSRFLANMSHELRTPLNAIIGFSELLLNHEDVPPAKVKEYLSDICSGGRHLLSVINDILDISRIEAGKIEVNDEDVSPAELIDTAARMVRPRAETAGITLTARVGREVPDLHVDRRLMTQALLNFASNAVKFTERGGRVDLEVGVRAEGAMDFVIRDTGIGMSPEDVARVGEPFLQADGRLSRKFEGTGLGLVIAKRLVELHGGELIVDSKLGVGTTMTVRLPSSRLAAPTPLAVAS